MVFEEKIKKNQKKLHFVGGFRLTALNFAINLSQLDKIALSKAIMSREGMYVENHVLNLASIGERIRKFQCCGPLRNRPRVVVRLSFAFGQRQVGLFFSASL